MTQCQGDKQKCNWNLRREKENGIENIIKEILTENLVDVIKKSADPRSSVNSNQTDAWKGIHRYIIHQNLTS